MPCQFPPWERSPFFGSFTRWPRFQSAGTRSCSQILFRRDCSISADVVGFALSASGGMPSVPLALLFFVVLIALMISALEILFLLQILTLVDLLFQLSPLFYFGPCLWCHPHFVLSPLLSQNFYAGGFPGVLKFCPVVFNRGFIQSCCYLHLILDFAVELLSPIFSPSSATLVGA